MAIIHQFQIYIFTLSLFINSPWEAGPPNFFYTTKSLTCSAFTKDIIWNKIMSSSVVPSKSCRTLVLFLACILLPNLSCLQPIYCASSFFIGPVFVILIMCPWPWTMGLNFTEPIHSGIGLSSHLLSFSDCACGDCQKIIYCIVFSLTDLASLLSLFNFMQVIMMAENIKHWSRNSMKQDDVLLL